MFRVVKVVLLGLVVLTLLAALIVFFQPSLLINRDRLVKWLKSAPVTYAEIDLTVTTPSIFARAVHFSAKDFCVKGKSVDACFPTIALDAALGITSDGLRLKQITKLELPDARVSISEPPAPATHENREPSHDSSSPVGFSLALRALELIADLRRVDVFILGIERLNFAANLGGASLKGELNITRSPDAIRVDLNSSFNGKAIQLWASFGKEIQVSVSSMGRRLAALRTDADLFLEFFEYLRSTELYWLRTKHLPINIDVADLGGLLDLLGVKREPLDGKATGLATLNFNRPSLGDAFFGLHFFSEFVDGDKNVFVDAELDYHLLQKIPVVGIKTLKSSAGESSPADDFLAAKLLRAAANQLELQVRHAWVEHEIRVILTRDYSKLARKIY